MTNKINERLQAIQKEHEQICNKMDEMNKQLSQMSARRIALEGAFMELQDLIKDDDDNEVVGVVDDNDVVE